MSDWAATLAVLAIFRGIYGMNSTYIPELRWKDGYPILLMLIELITTLLDRGLKRAGWLWRMGASALDHEVTCNARRV
ncbi:MAG: hypothetical protein M3338_05505 [Actinomycetota bacterium]|nr:hypothetical protein [Actinomycetota bacterium]